MSLAYVERYPRLAHGAGGSNVLRQRQRVGRIVKPEPDDPVAGGLEPGKKSVGVGQGRRRGGGQDKERTTVHGASKREKLGKVLSNTAQGTGEKRAKDL